MLLVASNRVYVTVGRGNSATMSEPMVPPSPGRAVTYATIGGAQALSSALRHGMKTAKISAYGAARPGNATTRTGWACCCWVGLGLCGRYGLASAGTGQRGCTEGCDGCSCP